MGSSKGLIDMALVLVMLLLAVAVPSARCLLVSEEVVTRPYPPEKYCDIHVNHTLCHYQVRIIIKYFPLAFLRNCTTWHKSPLWSK